MDLPNGINLWTYYAMVEGPSGADLSSSCTSVTQWETSVEQLELQSNNG